MATRAGAALATISPVLRTAALSLVGKLHRRQRGTWRCRHRRRAGDGPAARRRLRRVAPAHRPPPRRPARRRDRTRRCRRRRAAMVPARGPGRTGQPHRPAPRWRDRRAADARKADHHEHIMRLRSRLAQTRRQRFRRLAFKQREAGDFVDADELRLLLADGRLAEGLDCRHRQHAPRRHREAAAELAHRAALSTTSWGLWVSGNGTKAFAMAMVTRSNSALRLAR